jgi:hypothetical protein
MTLPDRSNIPGKPGSQEIRPRIISFHLAAGRSGYILSVSGRQAAKPLDSPKNHM